MENIFITLTNLYSLRAINIALKQKKYSIAVILSCVTISSVIYHLSETKHGMDSVCLKDYTMITLNIDRFFALCSIGLFAWKYKYILNKSIYKNTNKSTNKQILLYSIVGMIAQMLSECQHIVNLDLSTEKRLYMITHPIWHICAFHTAYLLLLDKNN